MADEQEKHKEPIGMTTDEAVEFFFPPEAVEHLRAVVYQEQEVEADDAQQSAPRHRD